MITNKEHSAVDAWAQCGRSAREPPMNAHRGWEPGHHAAARSAIPLAVCGGSAVAEVWARFGMKTPPSTQSHRLRQ